MRETILKIFDSSFIELNKKYKSSEKISVKSHKIATSNKSLKEQKADIAVIERFSIIETIRAINSEEYKIIKESLPLFIILAIYSTNSNINTFEDLYIYASNELIGNKIISIK